MKQPIDREESSVFQPKFDKNGLITAVVSEHVSGVPLMVAHMNEEALRLTLETGEAHFYSRSRKSIWHKGGTSGNTLSVQDIRIDCDQDAVWLFATLNGHAAACHTGRKSCFYRSVVLENGKITLGDTGSQPLFDPDDVYGKTD